MQFICLGKVCQALCGFAWLHSVFLPVVREGEDVQRPGLCSEWGLELGRVVGLEQYLGLVVVILLVALSRAWSCIKGEGDFERGRGLPGGIGDAGLNTACVIVEGLENVCSALEMTFAMARDRVYCSRNP